MPVPVDQTTPAGNRQSRTPPQKVAVTVATTGLATVASGALDGFQTGDLCYIVEAADGTAITGGTGGTTPIQRNQVYAIEKVSATTARLYLGGLTGTLVSNLGVAISAGASLLFGDPLNPPVTNVGTGKSNIIPMGSVAGGNAAGPLD